MKILHLMLACFYVDNYSYQENMLPKYHKKLGHDVEIVASLFSFNEKGNTVILPERSSYMNEYGIPVTRLSYRSVPLSNRLRLYDGLYDELIRVNPNVIFIHGVQFCDMASVVKYLKRKKGIRVFVDNHADYSNSATNWISKNIQHKIIWKHYAKMINPYVEKFYGVLPARVEFLKEVYCIPSDKCSLLVMGADDEAVEYATNISTIDSVKKKYGILPEEMLLVTGGKINSYRPEVLELMQAVIALEKPNVKLLIFGNVSTEYKQQFEQLLDNPNLIYAGWQNAKETYALMAAADLVIFPGLHSVMWEQAVAVGAACMFRDIQGFHHVDLGRNAVFVNDVSKEGLMEKINELIENRDKLFEMKKNAREQGMQLFSYMNIAKKCIE